MGYYSKVSVLVGKKVAGELFDLKKIDRDFPFKDEEISYNGKEGRVRFYAELKWYEGTFEDVDRFMAIIRKRLDEPVEDDGSNFVDYLRIGEEEDDVEHECNSFTEQYIAREPELLYTMSRLPDIIYK